MSKKDEDQETESLRRHGSSETHGGSSWPVPTYDPRGRNDGEGEEEYRKRLKEMDKK